MAYQKPKADHPWKTGKMPGWKPQEEKHQKTVKLWIQELAMSYEKIEMYNVLHGKEGKFFLWQLPQSKQAAWIAGMLKKNYVSY